MSIHAPRSLLVVLLSALLVVGLFPGLAAARTGGGQTVVVEEGETVSSVNAFAGSVMVRGTVTSDVSAVAGNVLIEGTVEGDVNTATGNLQIPGTVEGDVSAGAGNVHLEEGGVVGGNFQVGAGNVRIDGDAIVGAETITLGENAAIAGSLTYDGALEGNRDAVAGDVTRDRSIGTDATGFQPFASWVFALYAFFLNLVLGAILLAAFPRFSEAVAERVKTDPIPSRLVGLGVLVGVPVVLVLLLVTIVGIPLSLAGMAAFALFVWVAVVYGRFAVGSWLLSLADAENSWLALVVGLLLGAVLSLIPYVGGLVNAVIFLLGLGLGVYIVGTVGLLANIVGTYRASHRGHTRRIALVLGAYLWLVFPVLWAPLVLLYPETVPGAAIEMAAIDGLVFGWMLQLAMAFLPVVTVATDRATDDGFVAAVVDGAETVSRPSWLQIGSVNAGMLALWVRALPVVETLDETLVLVGYGLIALAWALFIVALWRGMAGVGAARVDRDAQSVADPATD